MRTVQSGHPLWFRNCLPHLAWWPAMTYLCHRCLDDCCRAGEIREDHFLLFAHSTWAVRFWCFWQGRSGRRLARRFGFLKQLSGFFKHPFTDTSQRVRGALGRLFGSLLQVGGVANVRCCGWLDYVSGVPVGRRYLHGESPCPSLPSDGELNPEKSFINWVSRDDWRFHRNAIG